MRNIMPPERKADIIERLKRAAEHYSYSPWINEDYEISPTAEKQSSKKRPRKTRTILNTDQVAKIRQIGKRLSVRNLAIKFNTSESTIYRVLDSKRKPQKILPKEVTPLPWNLLAAAFALGCIITGAILTFLPIPFTL
tara:strand:+ start:128 stop:541 length:414 start_codon:yes stop_codon:yes gene_type:complete